MDIIKIEQLEVYGYHGVFEEEKKQGQPFMINVEMKTDFLRAAREDELNYSTHYGEVCLFIKDIFKNNKQYFLLIAYFGLLILIIAILLVVLTK